MKVSQNIEDNKKDFIIAGEKIIRDDGVEALTMRRIISDTGKSNGTFYACYRDKDELLDDIFKKYTEVMVEKLENSYDDKFDAYTNINNNIKKMVSNSKKENKNFLNAYLISGIKTINNTNPIVVMLKKLFDKGIQQKNFNDIDSLDVAYSVSLFIYASLINFYSNEYADPEELNKIIENYLGMVFEKSVVIEEKKDLDTELIAAGVDIESGVIRFSDNKESYMGFLRDFFYEPDFANCKKAIEEKNVSLAFEYAHGLKGLAGTLSIKDVYKELVKLVEILRKGTLEGAMEAYNKVSKECRKVTEILEHNGNGDKI